MFNQSRAIRDLSRLLLLFVIPLIASNAHSANAEFENLRSSAKIWKQSADTRTLDRFNEAAAELADCPEEVYKDESTLIVDFLGTRYQFYSIDRPNGKHCFFMVEPFRRPLSLGEALDLQAALLMAPRQTPSAQKATEPHEQAEERFRQLLNEADRLEDRQQVAAKLESRTFDDCSRIDANELRARPGDQATRFIYNGAYSWKEVESPSGICIFMDLPLGRGLSIEEARSFVRSTQIAFPAPSPTDDRTAPEKKKKKKKKPVQSAAATPAATPNRPPLQRTLT